MIVDKRADEIELTTGVTIMVKASDLGGVRGPTIESNTTFAEPQSGI